jgi:hypothetical protein
VTGWQLLSGTEFEFMMWLAMLPWRARQGDLTAALGIPLDPAHENLDTVNLTLSLQGLSEAAGRAARMATSTTSRCPAAGCGSSDRWLGQS